jgi:D-3-phosphoglycerate dehydrogenase
MTKVAVLGTRFGALDIEAAELAGLGVELVQDPGASADAIVAAAGDAVAILAGSPPRFGRDVLSRLPNTKAIVRYGVGVETIDLAAAAEFGIVVANVPDYCAEEVATHTMALVLACVRRLLPAHRLATGGRWELGPLRPLFSSEEQTMGLIGLGRIGLATARKARAFGYQILVADPYATDEALAQVNAERVEVADLLRRSDVVSLHAPLLPSTHHLVNAAALATMKPSAVLVNTSRGGLIDEAALEQALRSGTIAAAGLDVMEREPVPGDHPLLQVEQAIITPHMAWYTEQSTVRMRQYASREVARVLRGEPVLHQIKAR